MSGTSRFLSGALLGGAALISGAEAADAAAPRPLLLELFTSQGCSSCPPADAVLRELAAHPDLLPLAFHVDYWNGLGWVDRYSSPAFSRRQRDYAEARGFEVYTPQLVVEGHEDVVGSSRGNVEQAIASARGRTRSAPAAIRRDGQAVDLKVGAIPGATVSGTVYLLSFDSSDTTRIEHGENAGRTLDYVNVVRSLRRVGEWHNQPLQLAEQLRPEERGDRLALLVQDPSGTVWALASTPAPGR